MSFFARILGLPLPEVSPQTKHASTDIDMAEFVASRCHTPTPSGSPANGVVRWARSPTVRPAWSPAMPARTAIPWSIGACICTNRGSRPRIARAGSAVASPMTSRSALDQSWRLSSSPRCSTRQVLPFRWVTCDEAFGQNPAFLDALAALKLSYLAEVPHATRVWRERPPTAVPPRGKRRPAPTRERLTADAPAPLRVDVLAAQVPGAQWQRYQIKEGAKGPMVAEFAFLRVVPVRDDGARTRELAGAAAEPGGDAGAEDLSVQCAGDDTAPEAGVGEWDALAGRVGDQGKQRGGRAGPV